MKTILISHESDFRVCVSLLLVNIFFVHHALSSFAIHVFSIAISFVFEIERKVVDCRDSCFLFNEITDVCVCVCTAIF